MHAFAVSFYARTRFKWPVCLFVYWNRMQLFEKKGQAFQRNGDDLKSNGDHMMIDLHSREYQEN